MRTASAAGLLCVLALSACSERPILFNVQEAGISNQAFGETWYGPYPVDLGDARAWSDFADPTVPSSTTFYSSTQGPHSNPQSFGTFQIQADGTRGVLLTSLWDGDSATGFFRPFGRVYNPVSQGGAGWASYGPQASFLDTTTPIDAFYVALGLNPEGAGLAVFADGAAGASLGNMQLRKNGTWAPTLSQSGSAVPPLDATTVPGAGYVPEINAHPGFAVNGTPSSLAWDQGGHAYYAYVDNAAGANQTAYLQTYTAFTLWATDAAGGTFNGQRLGPRTSQVQAVHDGYGVTQFWRGEDLVQATGLALGQNHGCALEANGIVCWGINDWGQVGNGELGSGGNPNAPVQYPAAVEGLGGTMISLSSSTHHNCAVSAQGSIYCWGACDYGQCGNRTEADSLSTPTGVAAPSGGFAGPFVQVSAGGSHTCAVTSLGSGGYVYCWGSNLYSQLGDEDPTDATAPFETSLATYPRAGALLDPYQVANATIVGIIQVAAGDNHTCVLKKSTNQVYCVGRNDQQQIGYNSAGADATNWTLINTIPTTITQISAAGNTTCALSSTGNVYCWGLSDVAQAGTATNPAPPSATEVMRRATQISVGKDHACALLSDGTATCWGAGGTGALGYAAAAGSVVPNSATPALVEVPEGVIITSIAAGEGFTCATTSLGPTYCWGTNANYRVGGTLTLGATQTTPIELAGALSANDGQALHAYWTAAPNEPYVTVSTGDVKSMAAAADEHGNVLAVYLMADPGFVPAPTGTISTAFPIRNPDVRVYASVRGAEGVWSGPTRIDDAAQLSEQSTTTFQDAWGRQSEDADRITGGIEYFTPGVAYVGNGKFMAAFAITDLTGGTSSIYVRTYTVGDGWAPASQTELLDRIWISPVALEAYRYANDLHLAGDGQGDAVLSAQVVVPSGDASSTGLRNYGMKTYAYSESRGGWAAGFLIPYSICPATATAPTLYATNFCWELKPQGMVFPGAEAVVVYPAPAALYAPPTDDGRQNLRLFSTELHL